MNGLSNLNRLNQEWVEEENPKARLSRQIMFEMILVLYISLQSDF